MDWNKEWKVLAWILAIFLGCFYLPVGSARFDSAVLEAFLLVKWYAREHVLLCLVPAFFIAGAIAVFISQASVMKYLGARANKIVAYGVASVSGSVLAVCSCKWLITSGFALVFSLILVAWFGLTWRSMLIAGVSAAAAALLVPGEPRIAFAVGVLGLSIITGTRQDESGEWFGKSWGFAKQILPLLMGKGPALAFAPRRSSLEPAEHARYPKRDGNEEDRGLRHPRRRHGHLSGLIYGAL